MQAFLKLIHSWTQQTLLFSLDSGQSYIAHFKILEHAPVLVSSYQRVLPGMSQMCMSACSAMNGGVYIDNSLTICVLTKVFPTAILGDISGLQARNSFQQYLAFWLDYNVILPSKSRGAANRFWNSNFHLCILDILFFLAKPSPMTQYCWKHPVVDQRFHPSCNCDFKRNKTFVEFIPVLPSCTVNNLKLWRNWNLITFEQCPHMLILATWSQPPTGK